MVKNLRIFLIILGSLFLTNGIYRGEVGKVLLKATRICLECIGVG